MTQASQVLPAAETCRIESSTESPAPAGVAVSIIIPAYNEKARLPQTLEAILAYLGGMAWSWEVIVADDGSRDGTADLVEREFAGCRVLRAERNQGKGSAVRRGMLAARGALRLFSDADLSTPIDELPGIIDALEAAHADIAIASRALPESRLIIRQPWWREASGRLFNRIVQPLSGLPFVDTQCGFKLFRAEAADFLFERQQCNGWAFDVEILMLAQYYGYKIIDHPVRWINNDASKVSLFQAAPRMVRDVLRFRWRRFIGGMADSPGAGGDHGAPKH